MGLLLKLAIFAAVAYFAWTIGRRWLRGFVGKSVQPQQPAPPPVEPRPTGKRVVEETSICRVCNAYVSTGAAKCGRSDCPLP